MVSGTSGPRRCPRCGHALGAGAPEGLCGVCVLLAATETMTSGSTDDLPTVTAGAGAGPATDGEGRLSNGQLFGAYRIDRMLGHGGMGEVYAAEHLQSGRRVAVKLLRTRLHTADARARFLLEGQLAASISHPHTVYIFGSEEIDGIPVISMELVPGGTLKDRVAGGGPLPPAEPVAVVLDVLGGLDAAHAAGILHRDVKPSNCFVDLDGSVKVGDFGLSISTLARDVRHALPTDGFEGTPQFAPPEQLRGEPLDVRADIYAVGATLYYLLTGHPPFDAPDLRALYAQVTGDAPASPRRGRPEIPPGLAALVVQCLAKSPGDRPASYAALADALRPFTTASDAPARPGPRFVAAAGDAAILAVPITIWMMLASDPVNGASGATAALGRWTWLGSFAYYVMAESVWGASIGKRLMGLRVTSADGSRADWWRIVLRTAVCFTANPLVTAAGAVTAAPLVETLRLPVTLGFAALLFATARRHNGWAAVHDLVSGTKVVARPASEPARTGHELEANAPPQSARAATLRFGPFAAFSDPVQAGGDRLAMAFDPVLRRQVWIHLVPPEAPPVTAARRDVSRIGRLHWLTGRRSAREHWDAYEAPGGAPFLAHPPARWPQLKRWLVDLATELAASDRDGTMPALLLDRLWIRRDGHLVLLDFAAPGVRAGVSVNDRALTPIGLLSAVALRTVTQDADPASLPLSARALFERWRTAPEAPVREALAALTRVAAASDRVRAWRRGVPIALAAGPVVTILLAAMLLLPPLFRFATNSQTMEIVSALQALSQTSPRPGSRFADPAIRDAAERYLAGRHGAVLRDDAFWDQNLIQSAFARLRPSARDILARHPTVSSEALAHASTLLAPELAVWSRRARQAGRSSLLEAAGIIVSTLSAAMLALGLLAAIVSSAIVPGGLVLRQLGYAVVTGDGREIGRMRSLLRVGVAWLPAIVWLGYLAASPRIQGFVPAPPAPLLATALALGTLGIGAVWTIARPTRGPHDRVTGTWVTPR